MGYETKTNFFYKYDAIIALRKKSVEFCEVEMLSHWLD